MIDKIQRHLINESESVKQALTKLNKLASNAILFVVNDNNQLLGSLTDGDVRRGLIDGKGVHESVANFIQSNPKIIQKHNVRVREIVTLRKAGYKVLPIIDSENRIVDIINLRENKSYLPIDAVIMAGGKGTRLLPLTETVPKPLLKVGDKPIIEHNIDRLVDFGIKNINISINYLGEQLESYFGNGQDKGIKISFLREEKPLGTIGVVSAYKNSIKNDCVLVMNSDLLTNIDYEEFYLDFLASDADFALASIPYDVNIPYAVIETNGNDVVSFKEKPTYTYYSNGGIYLMKKEVLNLIPVGKFFNTTDLMDELLKKGKKIQSFPLLGYWLDIGKHEDFKKAQEDIKHLKLD